MLAEVEILERGGDLVDLFHAGAHRAAAHEHEDVARVDLAALDGGDGGLLGEEDAGRARLAIDAVAPRRPGIDGGALDDRAVGREVAVGKVTVEVRPRRRAPSGHDHVVGVDAVRSAEHAAQRGAAFGLLPPVEHVAERLAGDGQRRGVEQARAAQVQHHFGHAAGEEDLHGGMHLGPFGSASTRRGTWR